jgi:hypothetical protein
VLAALKQTINPVGVLVLGLFEVERNNSEVDFVLAHESNGQAGKGAA